MLAMIDMKISNLYSVREAFRKIGSDVQVVSDPKVLQTANAIVLPGVGAFEDGMRSLREQELLQPLRQLVLQEKKPIFGICLGMQLLADESEEFGRHEGLGFVRGKVKRLTPTTRELRVPNMGWCDVVVTRHDGVLFSRRSESPPIFYFAHSYHLDCDEETVAARIDFGDSVTAAIEKDHIFGIQFHPEKSQSSGLDLLASFSAHVEQATFSNRIA